MFATQVAPGGHGPHPAVSLLSTLSFDPGWLLPALAAPAGLLLLAELLGLRRVPPGKVGVVEKRWSPRGCLLPGQVIALGGEAGFQPDVLSPGFYLGLWRWQYRLHNVAPVVIGPGKIGYVHARDGEPLPAGQSLGRAIACDHYQDARAFLAGGQRGRQRALLGEGTYAINLALFAVLTEEGVRQLGALGQVERLKLERWQKDLRRIDGFAPVVVAARSTGEGPLSLIGLVTVHEGPSMPPGQRLAAEVAAHEDYQDVEAFLKGGGCRGRQAGVLGRGVYYINRWFATVQLLPGERIAG
jgi:uncharacterized membrane protein YqiK